MRPGDPIWYRIGADSIPIPWARARLLWTYDVGLVGPSERWRIQVDDDLTFSNSCERDALRSEFRPRDPAEYGRDRPDLASRRQVTWSWDAILDMVAERAGWTTERFRGEFGDDDCSLHRFLESEGVERDLSEAEAARRWYIDQHENDGARIAALEERLAEVGGFDRMAADRLADEVAVLVVNRSLGSRSAAADALLDYRNPPRTERSDRLGALEETNGELADALKTCERRLPLGEDIARAYVDGRNEGRRDERARLRRELIDVIADRREESAMARPVGREFDQAEVEKGQDIAFTLVLAALDRICPEEKS